MDSFSCPPPPPDDIPEDPVFTVNKLTGSVTRELLAGEHDLLGHGTPLSYLEGGGT